MLSVSWLSKKKEERKKQTKAIEKDIRTGLCIYRVEKESESNR
jgi:hypothetical protein